MVYMRLAGIGREGRNVRHAPTLAKPTGPSFQRFGARRGGLGAGGC